MSTSKLISSTKISPKPTGTSKPVKLAYVCVLLLATVVFLKSGYEFASMVGDVNQAIAPTTNMPLQADGAFYFIEPATTAAS